TPGTHFLFNMAVLPQYRKMGVATALMNYAVDQIRGRIYGMTHNRVMQQSIAPQLNFKPLGTVYVVPINKNDYLEKSLYRDDP
ncbi:MAG TPA: GNAT family N-acetyltransferase, partial [Pseudobdellovibrionaceae bacterium]|nr:GNAT family N-acetyltransferase [Pseudobdellovibrionaceae bacterium]